MWPAPALAIAIGRRWCAVVRPARWPRRRPFLVAWLALAAAWPTASAGPAGGRDAADRRRAPAPCGGSRARPGSSSRRSSATRTTGSRPTTSRRIPDGRVAHRTSPTNKGLLLLSTLAANDLGYIGPRRAGRAAGEDVRHARPAGEALGPLLQLVPDARRSSRCRRGTSRRSTAATCWAA